MIPPQEKTKLEALKKRVKCPKQFACVGASLDELCKGVYHPHLEILECLEPRPISCGFAKPFASTFACTCPLRIYIAEHLEQWSAESTIILRRCRPGPGAP